MAQAVLDGWEKFGRLKIASKQHIGDARCDSNGLQCRFFRQLAGLECIGKNFEGMQEMI